jgi:hypothetical protein
MDHAHQSEVGKDVQRSVHRYFSHRGIDLTDFFMQGGGCQQFFALQDYPDDRYPLGSDFMAGPSQAIDNIVKHGCN